MMPNHISYSTECFSIPMFKSKVTEVHPRRHLLQLIFDQVRAWGQFFNNDVPLFICIRTVIQNISNFI